uniref:Uncharacterized protein n=1 Tax=viral metagenome TaxID=1070528 RepID=A0A6M3LKN8_9ZZZZ
MGGETKRAYLNNILSEMRTLQRWIDHYFEMLMEYRKLRRELEIEEQIEFMARGGVSEDEYLKLRSAMEQKYLDTIKEKGGKASE